jgi:O-methyltransferase
LDVDLYAPTLAGLEYFYPRLAIGGIMFVHDYNNLRYKGVKSAVDKFQKMTSCVSMPIADCAGSIVILK